MLDKNASKFTSLVVIPKEVEELGGREFINELMSMGFAQLPDDMLKQVKFDVSDPKITGNTATCMVRITVMGKSDEQQIKLVNDNGWKVVFD